MSHPVEQPQASLLACGSIRTRPDLRHLPRLLARAAVAAAVLAVALLAGDPGARAQTEQQQQMPEPEEIARHGDWGVQCFPAEASGQRHCEAVQVVADESSQQPLLRVAVGKAANDGRAILQFIVPLGTQLQRGFKFSVDDGAPRELTATTCLQFGCIVEMLLDSNWVASMRRGAMGRMTVVDLRGQEVAIPISLSGFTAASGQVL